MRSLVFGFVVVPNFSLIALSACVDPLRLANQVLGHTVYQSVLLSVDGGLVTSSDGIQVMTQHSLAQAPGNRNLANEVANLLIAERRSLTDVQTVSIIHQSRVTNPVAIEVLRLMEANVAEPLPIGELAQLAGVSLRSLQRLFKQKFERSAERVYLDIRLAHARLLVHRSEKSVREIAARTGFASPSHLTARYTPRYGASPQKDREKRAQGMASKDRLLS